MRTPLHPAARTTDDAARAGGGASSEAVRERAARCERWLVRHADAMYAYALLRLGEPGDAEDCVQEALLGALESDDFRGEATERTWLIGILRHKVLDCVRRRAREAAWARGVAQETSGEDGAFRGGSWAEAQGGWDEPGLSTEALRGALREAVAGLPPAMRTALCLREIDGLSTEQTCDLMGITPTNLWTLVHRAKVRLRAIITESLGEGGAEPR